MGTVSLPLQPDKSPTVKTNIKNGWTRDFIDYLLPKRHGDLADFSVHGHLRFLDDVFLHRCQCPEQFVLLAFRDLEFIQCGD